MLKMALLEQMIPAAGLTRRELAARIDAAFVSEKIFAEAAFSVESAMYALEPGEAYVSGEVRNPRRFGLFPSKPIRLREAISSAGGFSEFADRHHVRLERGGKILTLDLTKPKNKSNNPVLQNRDHFVVPPDVEKERAFLERFRFSTGDVFRVEITDSRSGRPAKHMATVVAANGTVRLPEIKVEVCARRLSITELEKRMAEACQTAGIADEPVVVVKVLIDHRRVPHVTVRGDVAEDTRVPWRDGMRMMEAIEFTGGLPETADKSSVKLIRGSSEESWNLDKPGFYEPLLKNGDQIVVSGK
jgi:protein involved in polysaccharide export with SLBB domain